MQGFLNSVEVTILRPTKGLGFLQQLFELFRLFAPDDGSQKRADFLLVCRAFN